MPGPDGFHNRSKTPPEVAEHTTPYGTPTASAKTAELRLSEPSLGALHQRYDNFSTTQSFATAMT